MIIIVPIATDLSERARATHQQPQPEKLCKNNPFREGAIQGILLQNVKASKIKRKRKEKTLSRTNLCRFTEKLLLLFLFLYCYQLDTHNLS